MGVVSVGQPPWGVDEASAGGRAGAAGDRAAFASTLREAIEARGLGLERLRHHLALRGHDLSVATLSYWQSGRSTPERAASLAALGSLEDILEVPPGFLTGRLPARRTRAVPPPCPIGPRSPVFELLEQLRLWPDDGFERVSAHESLQLRPDRSDGPCVIREVVRATREGFDRFPVGAESVDPNAYLFCVPVTNCRLGRVAESADGMALVAELVLERPLALGESMIVEYRVEAAGATGPSLVWERTCRNRFRSLHVDIRFPDGDPPLWVETYERFGEVETARPRRVVGTHVEVLLEDFGPGTFGVRWRW